MNTKYVNLNEAMGRLEVLMVEAVGIIQDNPELAIERIAVNEHGVHQFHKIPALAPYGHLSEVLARYYKAQTVWRADPEADGAGDAYYFAETDIVRYPCRSLDEVRIKANFILSDDNAFDSLRNCSDPMNGTPDLVPFLRSLLGGAVDIGRSGALNLADPGASFDSSPNLEESTCRTRKSRNSR